jgi:hypothetical protein
MKAKECLKKSMRLVGIGIRKATSYKVVKSRLNYRWYNDEYLQARLNEDREHVETVINER